jgi:hypothetical protein
MSMLDFIMLLSRDAMLSVCDMCGLGHPLYLCWLLPLLCEVILWNHFIGESCYCPLSILLLDDCSVLLVHILPFTTCHSCCQMPSVCQLYLYTATMEVCGSEEGMMFTLRPVWLEVLKFNKYCSTFVLFDKKFSILD